MSTATCTSGGSQSLRISPGFSASVWTVLIPDLTSSPDLTPSPDLYLHMFSERLQQCGTVQRTPGASFCVPGSLRDLQYPEDVWTVLQQSFSKPCEVRGG